MTTKAINTRITYLESALKNTLNHNPDARDLLERAPSELREALVRIETKNNQAGVRISDDPEDLKIFNQLSKWIAGGCHT